MSQKDEKTIVIKQSYSLSKDLLTLLNTKSNNSDFTFTVYDEKRKEKPKKFPAHKLILASRR